MRLGPIFGWFDNVDLLVCPPNGRRETRAMAVEFQQYPTGGSSIWQCKRWPAEPHHSSPL